MTKVMVVESPNKVATLSAILGDGWKVLSSTGHVRDLPPKELGIEIPGFRLRYEYSQGLEGKPHTSGKARVDRIRLVASDAEMVYLATDPDREGEAIAWHLKEALGLREGEYQRVTFGSIERPAIMEALRKARKLDMDRVHAQEGRRALDRLVGFLVSPALSDMAGMNLSAGRVQSVALRLIVDQERAIRAFKVTNHFGAVVTFDDGAWSAKWDTSPFVSDDQPYVLDMALAGRAAACRSFKVVESESKDANVNPPSPFDTALLLQAASVKLKFGTDETMKAAQALFEGPPGAEHGFITYHRTDSVNFTSDSLTEIRDYARAQGLPLSEKPRTWKESDDAQEGHQAIRPTDLSVVEAGDTEAQRAVYRLIRERAIASQLAEARYRKTTVRLVATGEGGDFAFVAKGRVMTDAGWRVLTQGDAADEGGDDDDNSGNVPSLPVGSDKLADRAGEVTKLKTSAPPRFTEASLIKRLKADGIGRPATYNAIVKTIQQRQYVSTEKRMFVPTKVGEQLVDGLMKGSFSFMELGFTREMESQLDRIAKGEVSYLDVVAPAHAQLQQELIGLQLNADFKPAHTCPNCGAALRRLTRANKAPIWFCTGADTCKTFMDDDDGKPVARKTHPCPKCQSPMRRFKRKSGGGYGWVCSGEACDTFLDDHKGKAIPPQTCPKCSSALRRYPKKDAEGNPNGRFGWVCTAGDSCKTFFEDVDGKAVPIKQAPCPACQRPMYRRMGQYGWYWGCSGYREGCKTMMDDDGGKPVPKRPKASNSGAKRSSGESRKPGSGAKPGGGASRRK